MNSSSSKTYKEASISLYDHWLVGVFCPDMKGPCKVNCRMTEGRCWCSSVTWQHFHLIAERPGVSSLAGWAVFAHFLQKAAKSGDVVDVIEDGCHRSDAGMAIRCVECLDQKASEIRLDRQQSVSSDSWEKQGLSLGC